MRAGGISAKRNDKALQRLSLIFPFYFEHQTKEEGMLLVPIRISI
jgi:hypothetical protein